MPGPTRLVRYNQHLGKEAAQAARFHEGVRRQAENGTRPNAGPNAAPHGGLSAVWESLELLNLVGSLEATSWPSFVDGVLWRFTLQPFVHCAYLHIPIFTGFCWF